MDVRSGANQPRRVRGFPHLEAEPPVPWEATEAAGGPADREAAVAVPGSAAAAVPESRGVPRKAGTEIGCSSGNASRNLFGFDHLLSLKQPIWIAAYMG